MSTLKKKLIIIFISAAAIIFLSQYPVKYNLNRHVSFRTNGTVFQINKNGQWQDFLIKGINMGAAKPGFFPGELGIEKDEYLRWFKEIAAMNANAIRVYTILSPAFYEAFYEYNMFAAKPLYLFHGVWNNEEAISLRQNAYHPDINDEFKSDIEDLVDLLHGNKTIEPRFGRASGKYIWDVSPYVAGYILGIEEDAGFVINTNTLNAAVKNFEGQYLYTADASPYECWLAAIGDYAIGYESSRYKTQKPISWTNWITTDPLQHPSDPNRVVEDAVSVDIEHIKTKDSFKPGLFASYHIYPYYPEFMSYDPVYTKFIDSRGKPNPYEAYLMDLKAWHSVPVLVAEFGIPASRGLTHENIITGYNQGFVTEETAGRYLADMYDSIVESGCAGGLIFTWQDEWSKRSWNTMDYDLPERRAYWSNAQSSEQNYGILGFDPGEKKSVCYADGNAAEWSHVKPLMQAGGMRLSVNSDEKYVYFLLHDEASGILKNKYAIAAGALKDQGNLSFDREGLKFRNPASQCIIIDGSQNSAVYVDAYYDVFYRQYSLLDFLDLIPRNPSFEKKNSGIFNPINLVLRRGLRFPLTGLYLQPSFYETGRLLYGNANPQSPDYNSLADFCVSDNGSDLEMRIPWQLFNIADPSSKKAIGDLYAHQEFNINPVQIDGINFELYKISGGSVIDGGSAFYSWKPWDKVTVHERLKDSYAVVQKKFGEY